MKHKHKFEYIGLSNFKLKGSPYLYKCDCGVEKWGEELTKEELLQKGEEE